ncbi:hypothetical protein M441DRAFT_353818 [Trichoderma asperellum CBS 433.97]|uniref:Uncharacterized protein n=1 Tax=Trichoderma asperellum (strain ATCC 204424 / CBS 433.97 / NBRC 101777) TaxID=1042311 RepID=A0A2T3ZIP8_TRIA4|nr:hypothetical protein M441DRAFT_353818 [Trichoderma asperellum CBS 433.97]PTB44684.1 hypothetical protein M441DRAFT_353818 [Trichoderma asperellum CBS 433.97]
MSYCTKISVCSPVEVHMSCGSKASIAADSPCGNTVQRRGCCTCWKYSIIARQTASNAASGQSSALQHAPISICDLQSTSTLSTALAVAAHLIYLPSSARNGAARKTVEMNC